MIRALVLLWFCPIAFFWSWYFLSLNDLGFGLFFFSRELHDTVFAVYGATLGIDPASIPGLVAKALAVDSLVVFGLVAIRKRRAIAAFVRARRAAATPHSGLAAAVRDDSRSSAP